MGRSIRSGKYLVQVTDLSGIFPSFRLQEGTETDYRGQDIVKVVRYSAREPTDRLHLLRLIQLRFEQPLFYDIS